MVPDLRNRGARLGRLACSIVVGFVGTAVLLAVADQYHVHVRGIVWSFVALATCSIIAIALASNAILGHIARRMSEGRPAPLPRARVTSCRRRAP